MRRSDREVKDIEKIEKIISDCQCCRLGFVDGDEAYIVPMSFGYEKIDGKYTFYFHSAGEGRKIELIKKTHRACIEMDTNCKLSGGDMACDYTTSFQSVIGNGYIDFVCEKKEKERALNILMCHLTGKSEWIYDDKMLDTVCIFKLEVDTLSCKEHL